MALTRKGKSFAQLTQDADDAVAQVQYANSIDLLDTARRRAREDTGEMKRRIVVKQTGPLTYSIEAQAAHSIHNEYGTRYMSAQPFMRPAVAEVRQRAETRTKIALQRGFANA